eukprot:IDg4867t1
MLCQHGSSVIVNRPELMDAADADITLLLGLDVLEKEGIYVNNVVNNLFHHLEGWMVELDRKFEYLLLVVVQGIYDPESDALRDVTAQKNSTLNRY